MSNESIRLWCIWFGPKYAKRLKRCHQSLGNKLYIDKVFVKIGNKQQYLWRAVDQNGEVVDIFLQSLRDGKASTRFFERLLRNHLGESRKMVTDKLNNYGVAHSEIAPDLIHDTSQYANNCAEVSHQPARVREGGMRWFKSTRQAQRYLNVHAAVYNLLNLGRHLESASHYRELRQGAFGSWDSVTVRL